MKYNKNLVTKINSSPAKMFVQSPQLCAGMIEVSAKAPHKCLCCKGTGHWAGDEEGGCPACGGVGVLAGMPHIPGWKKKKGKWVFG